MNINTIENIIKENPTDRYLWEDKKTIDITLHHETKSFIELLLNFECPNCGTAVATVSETHEFTADVNGLQIECYECDLKMFLHKYVKF